LKSSSPFWFRQGDPRDTDGYAGRCYAPLVDLEIAAPSAQANSGAGLPR
jgi:hypothetical protein